VVTTATTIAFVATNEKYSVNVGGGSSNGVDDNP